MKIKSYAVAHLNSFLIINKKRNKKKTKTYFFYFWLISLQCIVCSYVSRVRTTFIRKVNKTNQCITVFESVWKISFHLINLRDLFICLELFEQTIVCIKAYVRDNNNSFILIFLITLFWFFFATNFYTNWPMSKEKINFLDW